MLKKLTLLRKIQLLIILFLLVVYGASQAVAITYINDQAFNSFMEYSEQTAEVIQESIEVYFEDMTLGLNFLKNSHENGTVDEAGIRSQLRTINETKDFAMNSFIVFNDGSFILEPNVDLSEEFDPRTREWYKMAYGHEGVHWVSPYEDKVTSSLVVTASMYVELADTQGVFGVDIKLDRLIDIITVDNIDDQIRLFLVDSDKIIVDSSDNYRNSQLSVLNDPELLNSGIVTGSIETEKGFYSINMLSFTELRLITFLPKDQVREVNNQMMATMSLIALATLIVGIAMSYILAKQIIRPIYRLADVMRTSSESGDIVTFDEGTTKDLQEFVDGYNTMAISANKQRQALEKLSSDLMLSEEALQKQYGRASELAYNDYLTGIPNRVSFEREMEAKISQNVPFTLCYIDLDNFKHINDTYGHRRGDEVLTIISVRLTECCHSKHYSARLSGDEFGLIINRELMEWSVDEIASRVLKLIEETIHIGNLTFNITASIGISHYPDDDDTYEGLMSNADIAMYEAKRMNKNQYTFFEKRHREQLINRINIEKRLLRSIENGEMYLCYQPLIDYKTLSVIGFEALARWEPIGMKPIYPDVFIPMAEHNLYINEIGRFVIEESMAFTRRLKDQFSQSFEMNINVSVVQLHQDDFLNHLFDKIVLNRLSEEEVNIEITESTSLEEDESILKKLEAIRKSGIRISLDDFGTGYSSISHMIHLSLTHMKIDRSIIIKATESNEVYNLVNGLVAFAHSIGLKVVAEGIEDNQMEELIGKTDVDIVQGYLYSRPLKEEDLIQYLEKKL